MPKPKKLPPTSKIHRPLVWLHGEVKTPPWSLAARDAGKRTVKIPVNLQPHLQSLARNKLPTAYLFPGKLGSEPDRAWPRKWVKRICKLAKVPVVCAHGMRGLHATLAIEAGTSPDVVARSLSHESASMTLSAYAVPGSAESATASRVQDLLVNTSQS